MCFRVMTLEVLIFLLSTNLLPKRKCLLIDWKVIWHNLLANQWCCKKNDMDCCEFRTLTHQKSSLPLVKVKIFPRGYFRNYLIYYKLQYIKRSRHICLFGYQTCKNWIKNKRILIMRTKSGHFQRLQNQPFNCTQLS